MPRDTYTTNDAVARRVYRALKTPTDINRRTDPILAFHFKAKGDSVIMRCNKQPEISVKGKDQTAGEVKFFAYSDFADYDEHNVIFKLREMLFAELSELACDVGGQSIGKFLCEFAYRLVDKGAAIGGARRRVDGL